MMTCQESRRLLLLARPGERARSEEMELKKHLKGCRECSAELRRVEAMIKGVAALRNVEPKPADPEALTVDILNLVAKRKQESERIHRRIFDFGVAIFRTPALRVGYALFAVVSIGILARQIAGMGDVSRRASPSSAPRLEVVYSVSAEKLASFPGSAQFTSLMNRGLKRKNGEVIVDKESLSRTTDFFGSVMIKSLKLLPLGLDEKKINAAVAGLEQSAIPKFSVRP